MNAATTVKEAARWRLDLGEPFVSGGFCWVAVPRAGLSLLVIARRPHLVALSDRRLLLWSRPHRARRAEDLELVLEATFDEVTLQGLRTFTPMLQLRLATSARRRLVLEFRPRERTLGHRIAEALGGPVGATHPAKDPSGPPSAEVPAAT